MGQPWGRLYTGTRNHRKITAIRRQHKDTWTYLYVLMECSFEADDEGKIYVNPNLPYSIEELADEIHFHKSPKFLQNLIETAVKVGLFSYENQIPQWLSYSERQFKSDTNVGERVRKHREKLKKPIAENQECNVTETLQSNKPVTDQIQIQIQNRTETDKPPIVPQRGNGFDADFLSWWKEYPPIRKTDRPGCFLKWKQLKKSGLLPDIETMLAILKMQKQSHDWQKQGGEFIPGPHPYLNKRRFLDESVIRQHANEPKGFAALREYMRRRDANGQEDI